MRVVAAVGGNMQAILDAQAGEISDALRAAIGSASADLLAELRGQVRAAGLGPGLEKAWQREVYPRSRKRTFRPAALVYSKSTVLHDAFDTGPTIRPARSGFLVIPTKAGEALGLGKVPSARKGGGVPGGRARRYADLEPFADRIGAEIASTRRGGGGGAGRRPRGSGTSSRIVLMPAKRTGLVAVLYRRSGEPVVIARLVPQVKLRKLLDIAGAEARADAALASALAGG